MCFVVIYKYKQSFTRIIPLDSITADSIDLTVLTYVRIDILNNFFKCSTLISKLLLRMTEFSVTLIRIEINALKPF